MTARKERTRVSGADYVLHLRRAPFDALTKTILGLAFLGCDSARHPFNPAPDIGLTPEGADSCNACTYEYCDQEWTYFRERNEAGDPERVSLKDDPLLSSCLVAWCGAEEACALGILAHDILPSDIVACNPSDPRLVVGDANVCCDLLGVFRVSRIEDGFSKWCPVVAP